MQGFANVTLCGTLGADAEVKVMGSGASLTKLRVAVTNVWKDAQGNKKEATVWVGCVDWNRRPDWMMQSLSKGANVCVNGTLRDDSYTDKDGKTVQRMVVNVDRIEVFARFSGNQQRAQQASQQPAQAGFGGSDDVPFSCEKVGPF